MEPNKTITILAEPMPIGREYFGQTSKLILRGVRDLFSKPNYNYGRYKGHYAVTRSLVEGLTKAGLPFIYSPQRLSELTDTVVVLAGVKTLAQAIALKRRGVIKKIFAGPNIVVFSSDHEHILANQEIDGVITPCSWVIDVYLEDNPSLWGRCFAWPAGVDVDYWSPGLIDTRRNVLIYEKQNKGPVGPVQPFVDYIESRGYTVEIIKYGSFNHAEYLRQLRQARLMVGFVRDESQGLAWAEAWAADVPTLIWRNKINSYQGRRYRTSTAPYLTRDTGLFFDDMEDFKRQFICWEKRQKTFSARAWTIANMSDEVCARKLFDRVNVC